MIGRLNVQIPADGDWHLLPTSPVNSIETVPFGIIDIDDNGGGHVRFPDLGGRMFNVRYTFNVAGDN